VPPTTVYAITTTPIAMFVSWSGQPRIVLRMIEGA
jgi:hypothetical protein